MGRSGRVSPQRGRAATKKEAKHDAEAQRSQSQRREKTKGPKIRRATVNFSSACFAMDVDSSERLAPNDAEEQRMRI